MNYPHIHTFVIYAFHVWEENVRFFLDHGHKPHPNVTYIFVQNHQTWNPDTPLQERAQEWFFNTESAPEKYSETYSAKTCTSWTTSTQRDYRWHKSRTHPRTYFLVRKDVSQDIGAYGTGLRFVAKLKRKYEPWIEQAETYWKRHAHEYGAEGRKRGLDGEELDHFEDPALNFVLVNSTMRGPFLPASSLYRKPTMHWSHVLTSKLDEHVAMVSPSINWMHSSPHCQSMVLAFDMRAFRVGMGTNRFMRQDSFKTKHRLIFEHEIALSTEILKVGYNMDCLMLAFQGMDWRDPKAYQHVALDNTDPMGGEAQYFGLPGNPVEVMFQKTNRKFFATKRLLDAFTEWEDHQGPKISTTWKNSLPNDQELYHSALMSKTRPAHAMIHGLQHFPITELALQLRRSLDRDTASWMEKTIEWTLDGNFRTDTLAPTLEELKARKDMEQELHEREQKHYVVYACLAGIVMTILIASMAYFLMFL